MLIIEREILCGRTRARLATLLTSKLHYNSTLCEKQLGKQPTINIIIIIILIILIASLQAETRTSLYV